MRRLGWCVLASAVCAATVAAQSPDERWRAVDALVARGRTQEAERAARVGGPETRVALVDLLIDRGRIREADSVLRHVTIDSPGARIAEAQRAELAARRGNRAEAARRARALIREYGLTRETWTARDLLAVGRAQLVVADGDAEAVRRALRAFDAAAERDSTLAEAPLRAADLFLSRFNAPDARSGYEAVLKRWRDHPRALLGLARVQEFEGKGSALDTARLAVREEPTLAAGHLKIAQLLLDAEADDSAVAAARRAIAADSTLIDAWGVIAAVAWTRGDSALLRETERQAQLVSSRPAAYFAALSDAAARQRRYAEARVFARRAVTTDSASLPALAALGTNAFRLGDFAEGRAAIERAFAIDPFNLWHKNTLDLLDLMGAFRSDTVGRFVYVGRPRELDILVPYLMPLLEESYDKLAARYGYQPPTPIRLELFDRHADFSVRTVGLAGLGALGVSFGTVLAMDTPSARERGTFNWGSTAWHELAHTFTLGVSGHRVPRWFSEGLSVLEEWRARPGWGAAPDSAFRRAFRAGELRPVSDLSEGFVRPRDPMEIGRSYVQAGLVCEMIEQTFGADAPARMLRAWGEGLATAEVVRRTLNIDEATLDRRFNAWLEQRLRAPTVARADDSDLSAIAADIAAAERTGRDSAAVWAYERLVWVWPYDIEVHERLAESAARAGMLGRVIRERRVVMALGPRDPLAARTSLARALLANNEVPAARREILRVLEDAPTYDAALTVLVEIRNRSPEE